jgi:hypothetical protein
VPDKHPLLFNNDEREWKQSLNHYEDLPAAGPLQQFSFAESTVFRCFRCGDTMKSKLITVYNGDQPRAMRPTPENGHINCQFSFIFSAHLSISIHISRRPSVFYRIYSVQ